MRLEDEMDFIVAGFLGENGRRMKLEDKRTLLIAGFLGGTVGSEKRKKGRC